MVLGAITIPPAVNTFGREKEVFAREVGVMCVCVCVCVCGGGGIWV